MCDQCVTAVRDAARALELAAVGAAQIASPVKVARYNTAQAVLAVTLKQSWVCELAPLTAAPLFPELDT